MEGCAEMITRDKSVVKRLVMQIFDLGEDKWFDYEEEFERFYDIAHRQGMERAAEIVTEQNADRVDPSYWAEAIREEAKK